MFAEPNINGVTNLWDVRLAASCMDLRRPLARILFHRLSDMVLSRKCQDARACRRTYAKEETALDEEDADRYYVHSRNYNIVEGVKWPVVAKTIRLSTIVRCAAI